MKLYICLFLFGILFLSGCTNQQGSENVQIKEKSTAEKTASVEAQSAEGKELIKDENQELSEVRLVALGDSFTKANNPSSDKSGDQPEYSFSTGTKIESFYLYLKSEEQNLVAFNLAESGVSSKEILNKQIPEALKLKPKYITILTGGKDILSGISVDVFKQNLKNIAEKLRKENTIILIGTNPNIAKMRTASFQSCKENKIGEKLETITEERIKLFNLAIKEVAEENELILVDLYDALGPDDVSDYDCLHPNLNGQKKVAQKFISALKSSKTGKLEGQKDAAAQVLEEKKFPRQNPSIYLGFWMPGIEHEGVQSMEKVEDLESIGTNTVMLGISVPYEKDGSIATKEAEAAKENARNLIRYYKEGGLVVILVLEPIVVNLQGEPSPLEEGIKKKFLEEFDDYVVEFAKIAEEENVEIFSPMNEANSKIGIKESSEWGQEILPKIKKVFKGKILWKAGSITDSFRNQNEINFKGYDILGFTSFPSEGIENYKEMVSSNIELVKDWAKKDNVAEVFISEFGTYKQVKINKEDEPKSISYVFDVGEGKVTGFIIFDPPQGFGTPIKGTEFGKVINQWFEKISGQNNFEGEAKASEWKKGGMAVKGKYADADIVDLGNDKYRLYYSEEPEVQGFEGRVYSAISTDGITWKEESGVRKTWAIFPSVIKLEDGKFRMYFQNAGLIKSAISSDGLNWEDEDGVRIDTSNSEGLKFENVVAPTVMKINNEYVMVYGGAINEKYQEKVPNNEIHLFMWATSKDGLNFEKKGIALDSRRKPFLGWLDGPELVKWDDGSIRLYFWSYKGVYYVDFNYGKSSEDEKLEFTTASDPNVLFPMNPPGDPTLMKIKDKWLMYYGIHTEGIGYATFGD